MTCDATDEPAVFLVKIWLCAACLEGLGEECHTPGCALWMHNSPGARIRFSGRVRLSSNTSAGVGREQHFVPKASP